MDITISATARALLDLRRRWPRKLIVESLAEHPQPRQHLLSGGLAAALAARFPDSTLKQSDNPPTAPASAHDGVVGMLDDAYPEILRHIPDPPLLLFYRGNSELLGATAVAVVGARRSTTQGRSNAQLLSRELVAHGITVVSGLALGIDGAAHSGALAGLRSGPGQQVPAGTIAVLGGGLAQLYPRRHHQLARDIVAAGGLLLSEYEDNTPPLARQFPERNRIISGLSMATVVVEATLKSGSLITARFAAEQGRDVLAMPGPVNNEVSAGCHRLIQQGAGLVSNAVDVIVALGLEGMAPSIEQPGTPSSSPVLDRDSRNLLGVIQGYPLSLDELLLQTGYEIGYLTKLLVGLELGGFVQQGPLGYSRAS